MVAPRLDMPFLMFSMQLDTQGCAIAGLNKGRLSLWDYKRQSLIQRWVFTTSIETKQLPGGWQQRGGICPPTSEMPALKMYNVLTKRFLQPGQPVDDGFLVQHSSQTQFATSAGTVRSEIMIHEDKNAPGSLGCFVALRDEYLDFAKVFVESCGQLNSVPLGVIYTF